ncbi:DUF551 domain-containing protein [Klebsiella quasipneumoniae]|uniref:DUF551 domain-containing protein n=1 Tax=Klebsiella quasipneumoniae TaxID=1463165 RepID=UPI001D0D8A3C|nr:DUF551 domain-containing protein [Klebsiella quasipneumoniae]
MTSKLTRERIELIANFHRAMTLPPSHAEIEELARMALAAMDSEPVAEVVSIYGDPEAFGEREIRPLVGIQQMPYGTKLYRHAQQPVVDADDNFYSWFGREWHENYQHNQYTTAAKQMLGVMAESAWKAGRRAAMLHAGKSPVIPDTWIPVSERMPEDEQEVLTINKMGHRFVSFFDKHSGLFFDRLDAPAACCIEHVLVTHWMPLPAGPQEVKGE